MKTKPNLFHKTIAILIALAFVLGLIWFIGFLIKNIIGLF